MQLISDGKSCSCMGKALTHFNWKWIFINIKGKMLKLNENNCPVEVVKCYFFGAYTLLFGLREPLAFNISPVKPNGFFANLCGPGLTWNYSGK